MKRSTVFVTIFLLCLVFITLGVLAFGDGASMEVGYFPLARIISGPYSMANEISFLDYGNVFYTKFDAQESLYLTTLFSIYAGGSTAIYMLPSMQDISFWPFYGSFVIRAGIKYGTISLNWEHECNHSIAPFWFVVDPIIGVDSGYDKVFLKVSF